MNPSRLRLFAWTLSALVMLAAIVSWGQDLGWSFKDLTAYQLFPVLGLTAFSLMWAHYVLGAVRRLAGIAKEELSTYFELTSLVVLFALVAHPGILILQLWLDGFGLPPQSYLTVYGQGGMKLAVALGSVSLIAFLAFELRRKFAEKSWWQYVSYASDVAMLAIVYHGLNLGGQLQDGWYRMLWYFYAVTLVVVILYTRFGGLLQGDSKDGR
jgi:hypothetical protein